MDGLRMEQYGECFWCVETHLSDDGRILLYADRVIYTPNGDVVFKGKFKNPPDATGFTKKDNEEPTLIIASGNWTAIYKASVWDSGAVCVTSWKGREILDAERLNGR